MFYYAEINSEYQVINKHCLSEESTNPNYILITEDLYTNGNELGSIVGQFYNKLLDVIEIVDPGWDMGQTCWMRYKNSQMRLSTKLDNMEYDINNLANGDSDSVSQEDLQALEDAIATKANANHSHTEYALADHSHNNYATQTSLDSAIEALESEIDGKANVNHTHSEYASSTHLHDEYANVNHNHDSDYAPLSHSHTDYVTSTTFDSLANEVDGKAEASHTHSNYATTSHNHNNAYISKDLQMTADNGDISISWSGKDVVAQFKALASGMYTAYSPIGNTNNPNSGEAFRFMCHKTGSVNYGWIMAYGGKGSVYTGYIDNGNWQGWKALWEYAPAPLWSGGANGGYYMTATHTITPTKKLSECRNGWALLWSDYDVGDQANNTDFYVSYIYKRAYTGQVWGGGEWYCDIPSYSAGTATDSEQRVIKVLQIYDAKIVGTANNAAAPRNDVVLRAVYEF